jgi:myo-inositol 2-dehydrogenase/D-chiro-inositol 1-dehydrogenase
MMVNVGVIGTGITRVHMKWLAQNPDVEICAIASTDPAGLSECSQLYEAKPYKNYQQMLDAERLDCVFVAIPPHTHGDVERELIGRGIPFHVEKPVSLTMELGCEVLRQIEAKQLAVTVGYQWRYYSLTEKLREMLSGSQIGLVEGRFWWRTALAAPAWWRHKAEGGGMPVEMATHMFDLMRYLFGEIVQVYCESALRMRADGETDLDIEDAIAATLRFESGVVGSVNMTYRADCITTSLTAVCRDATFYFDEIEHVLNANLVAASGEQRRRWPVEGNPYQRAANAFVDAVRLGRPDLIRSPYRDALKTLAVTLAVEASAGTGVPVDPRSLWLEPLLE